MKYTILLTLLLAALFAISQKIDPKLSKEQRQEMTKNIPVKDGKILYDEVITTDSSLTKHQLFIRIRQWFAENFLDSKSVLQVNDSLAGLLTGTGTYHYSNVNTLNFHTGYTRFILNAAVKDGKFRYQLYDFTAKDNNQPMLSEKSHDTEINLDDIVAMYNAGKREKYCRKFLDDMLDLVFFIHTTLSDLAKEKTTISDF